MNGWDLFTWIMAMGMIVGVVAVFAAFLRDARGVLKRAEDEKQ
jgi:hypothetical protein